MVVNLVIILRLNVLPPFPFTCFCSRWVLKAWYSLLTKCWLNWHPVTNNDNKTSRSLKGILIPVLLPRSHQWSKVLGYPFLGDTPLQEQLPVLKSSLLAPKTRRNLSLGSKQRHQIPFYGSLTRIQGRHSSVRFKFLTSTWILQERGLSSCRCLSIPVIMEYFLYTFQHENMKHIYKSLVLSCENVFQSCMIKCYISSLVGPSHISILRAEFENLKLMLKDCIYPLENKVLRINIFT